MSMFRKCASRFLRLVFETNPLSEKSKIEMLIDKAEIVSFDIFDTLLKRDVVNPEDVFDYVQMIYERDFGPLNLNFRELRLNAEKEAYAASKGREISIEQIYSNLPISDASQHKLMEIELAAEINLSRPNKAIEGLYHYARKKNKLLIITSDMYLPRSCIDEMLNKAGYSGYRLFLSSEVGVRKHDGRLFEHIIDSFNLPPAKILHIGDSIGPDFLNARKLNIESVLIPRSITVALLRKSHGVPSNCIKAKILNSVTNNLLLGEDYYYQFGVLALGPLLIGLCDYIRCGMEKRNQKEIFFLARDGYVVKSAFDILFPGMSAHSNYLYASRKAIGIPSIYDLDDSIEVGSTTRQISISRYLASFGLAGSIIKDLVDKSDYSMSDRFTKSEVMGNPSFISLSDSAFHHIREIAESQRSCTINYLIQEGINSDSAIFDLGWAGNIQGFMNRMLRKELNSNGVFGYYLALDQDKVRDDINYDALLGFDYPNMYLELVELCFSSKEGTTKGYSLHNDGEVKPILGSYEYENMPESDYVSSIQRGALDFVGAIGKLIGAKAFCDIRSIDPFAYFKRVGTNPTITDIEHFSNFRFEDNGEIVKLAQPESLGFYFRHPASLIRDLESSRWKPAFLKKLLKVPLPYYRLLLVFKRIIKDKRHG